MSQPSERMLRQIERLLDQADEAMTKRDWAAVTEITHAVLSMDPENRDGLGYLAAAEKALGSALAAIAPTATDPSFTAVLEPRPRPTPSPAAAGEGGGEGTSSTLPTSFVNGRYTVQRFLGEGGKKRVYLAHDEQLDRDVAFALLKSDGLDLDGLARIRREAQAMGRLGDHPHMVTVFDIGDEAGQPYIVSQYMAGGDLAGLIEQAENHRLPLDTALKIAEQICQALEHAHVNGVIHRDLKPGNVWLTASPHPASLRLGRPLPEGEARGELPLPLGEGWASSPVAKLGDFGLAIALDRSRLTQAGMMVGTVAYMAPEQAMGSEVSARSDLYSLGCLLYELVTGRPPFVGDESVAIITQHLNTPPVSPAWHVPDLPAGLEALILRLLEKDAAKRPGSAGEVREALAAIAAHPSLQLSPAGGEGEGEGGRAAGAQDPTYRRVFVGRENELRQLQQAFDRALSGQGSLLAVVGEPGIGKTALCEQIATYVAVRGGKTLVGHCYEEGSLSLPYLAFIEALRSYVLTRDPEGLKSDLGSGASEIARIVTEVRDRVQVESREASTDPDEDRWRLYQAVAGFLKNASSVQPLLIVLEDLHWADRGTLDLLVHLSRQLGGARLLIVGNYRDVEVDRTHPLSGVLAELRRASDFQRIPLRGLTVDEVHRMMSVMRGQEVSWGRAEAIFRQTEGNPLFVQEVLRYLVEEGLVVREGGRYVRTDGTNPESGIPEGLKDVIGKRLSRLSAECNRVLTLASVIGRDFQMPTLQLIEPGAEEAIFAALEEAVRVGVLEDTSRAGQVRFRFAHAFFRQTLYEEIFTPRRLRLHQQVARALEQQYGGRLEEHAAELAEHFANSSDPDDLEKAIAFNELAAKRSMAVYAYGEAAYHLERALQILDLLGTEDDARRCDLLLALGDALGPAGQPLRAYDDIAPPAFAIAEKLGDHDRVFRAITLARESSYRAGPGTRDLEEWGERAAQFARAGSSEQVIAHNLLGLQGLSTSSRLRESRALLQGAVDLARELGDPELFLDSALRVLVMSAPPAAEQAHLALVEEGLALPRSAVRTRTLGQFLRRSSQNLLAWGRRERADEILRELESLAERTRDADVIARWLSSGPIYPLLIGGDFEAALAANDDFVGRVGDLGMGGTLWGDQMERALHYLGRSDQALAEHLARPLRNAASFRRPLMFARAGRRSEAVASLHERVAWLSDSGELSAASSAWLLDLLEAAILLEDGEHARQLLPELEPVADCSATNQNGGATPGRILGETAARLGDHRQARSYYERALTAAAKIGFRPEIALTRLDLAELLLDHYPDERAAALDHLDFAIKEFETMKMAPSLEKAQTLRIDDA